MWVSGESSSKYVLYTCLRMLASEYARVRDWVIPLDNGTITSEDKSEECEECNKIIQKEDIEGRIQ